MFSLLAAGLFTIGSAIFQQHDVAVDSLTIIDEEVSEDEVLDALTGQRFDPRRSPDIEGNLITSIVRPFNRRRGFRTSDEDGFLGRRLGIRSVLRVSHDRNWRAGIAVDQDIGEPFRRRTGFDFVGAALSLRDIGPVRQIVLGDYTVRSSHGLVHWSSSRTLDPALPPRSAGARLRPKISSGEQSYLRGAALYLGREEGHGPSLMLLWSRRRTDARRDSLLGTVIRTRSGTRHRTVSEIARRRTLPEESVGVVFAYAHGGLGAGLEWSKTVFGQPVDEGLEPYRRYDFRGRTGVGTGAYLSVETDLLSLRLSGAVGANRRRAIVLAGALHGAGWRFSASHARYEPGFTALQGSPPDNINSYTIGLEYLIGTSKLLIRRHLFRRPWLTNRLHFPSHESEWLLQASSSGRLSYLVRLRRSVNTVSDSPTLGDGYRVRYPGYVPLTRLRARLRLGEQTTLGAVLNFAATERKGGARRGYAIGQTLRLPVGDDGLLQFGLSIFTTEPGITLFSGEASVHGRYDPVVLSGAGTRYHLLLKIGVFGRLEVGGKVNLTQWDTERSVGTGADSINTSWLADGAVSMRLSF